MVMMHLLLRLVLFVIGSAISLHWCDAEGVATHQDAPASEVVSLATKEKELKEKQAVLDAQVAKVDEQLKEQVKTTGIELSAPEAPVIKQEPTVIASGESVPQVANNEKTAEIESKVKALDTALAVPALAAQAQANAQQEAFAALKKEVEMMAGRLAALEAASNTSTKHAQSGVVAWVEKTFFAAIGFFMAWVWEPIKKRVSDSQSAAAK